MTLTSEAIETAFRPLISSVTRLLRELVAEWEAAEERLPREFANFCQSLPPSEAVAALVFEGDNAQDGKFEILTARSGLERYHLRARGRGSHSGTSVAL